MNVIVPKYLEPARRLYGVLRSDAYRKYWLLAWKLFRVPRFQECSVSFNDWQLSIPDSASFLSAYKEIFIERIYAFRHADAEPRILDLGANIGLSVLFFKQLYPKAQITAFEADPKIFAYLEKNVHGNGFSDVQLVNKAVWHENSTLNFSAEGADGGRVALEGDANLIAIDAVDISQFLQGQRFDFLKMDIEGAEELVLPACKEHLSHFEHIFVEYHSQAGRKQCLAALLALLSDAGFTVHVHSVVSSPAPFVELRINSGFDLQLNIFAWKP